MKKLVIIFAMFGLMFNTIGCKAKKAQDETEIVENADVEKIEAEDANFAGNEATVETGPVDESLQAALGETPQTDVVAAGTLPEDAAATTDVVNTDTAVNADIAAAPSIDETAIGTDVTASTDAAAAGLTETPVIDAPPVDVAQNEPAVDPSLAPDTTMTGAVSEMNTDTAGLTETPIIETPVDTTATIETPVAAAEVKEASAKPATTASSNALKKISETVPYKHGEGFVNTVYIARPKEKLADISRAIYGMDKSKELKSINGFLKSRSPKGGDKVYYISPNRPTDSSRTLSFYEDTGMMASTYVAEKGENLHKVSKKLLGYDNAWKEVWTTNEISSKTKLAKGDSIRYWRGAEQIQTSPTLAHNDGPAKIVEPAQVPEQMPPAEVAMNTPPPQEMTPPPAEVAQQQELPPPPPPPADMNQPVAQQQELPPPPAQEMAPPPPPPQELAAAPTPPVKQHNMEEEPAAEEMNSDTTMMIGVVAVLVAALALVLVRRNKKKKEADLASIEQNHVGT